MKKTEHHNGNENPEGFTEFRDDFQRQNPFNVPENYFDNLNEALMDRINNVKTTKVNISHSLNIKPVMLYVAITLFVMAGVSLLFIKISQDHKSVNPIAYSDSALKTQTPDEIRNDVNDIKDNEINFQNISDDVMENKLSFTTDEIISYLENDLEAGTFYDDI